jgi:hypothetical protein
VVADENTINCQADLEGAEPGIWQVIVTPQCGEAATCDLVDAVQVVTCTSDFNLDSQINFLDWAELAENWGQPCSQPLWCAGMDLDESGGVDLGDVAIIAEQWLAGASH